MTYQYKQILIRKDIWKVAELMGHNVLCGMTFDLADQKREGTNDNIV